MAKQKQQQWLSEFGREWEPPARILGLVEEGFLRDISWHNDSCPSFLTAHPDAAGQFRVIFVDHPKMDERELSGERFTVMLADADGDLSGYGPDPDLETEDPEEIVAMLRSKHAAGLAPTAN